MPFVVHALPFIVHATSLYFDVLQCCVCELGCELPLTVAALLVLDVLRLLISAAHGSLIGRPNNHQQSLRKHPVIHLVVRISCVLTSSQH